ncbi:perforin-1-like [Scomber scombrus]|uniref:perforin-1-like n=1 Tax=Scomber scombrus TaxID=13677 RepID=UPI002DD888EC|nr:perforin-1-like [Scomber scombrus]
MLAFQTLLIAVWLLPAVCHSAQLSCTIGQAEMCKAAGTAPGTTLAGLGFDVVTMKRTQSYVIDVSTWQQNNSCTLCKNPLMKGKLQRLPAAVEKWEPLKLNMMLSSTVYESPEAFIMKRNTDVKPGWTVGLNLNTTSLLVGGMQSTAARIIMAQSKLDKFSFITQEVKCSSYRYSLKQNPPVHPMFVQSIMKLPQQYNNQTKPDYIKFLATFGTHYTHKVDLGGRVKSVTSVQTCKAALDGYTEMEVRNCLNAEAAARASVKSTEIKAQAEYCKNALKRHNNKGSFSSTFKQRFTQVVGGSIGNTTDLLFSTEVKPATFRKWKNTLKINPEMISYSLYPLYQLVKDPVKKKGVKKATEDYILEHALIKHCSNKCTQGSTPSSHDPCACVCRPTKHITDNCCPQQLGVAHLTVTVKHATGLWGDMFTQTDGFVRVLMGNQTFQTKVINNNNNPKWNEDFYLGTVELPLKTKLKFEVWDEDNHWYDQANDLLGSCTKSVEAGSFTFVCPMNHGNLYFSYKAECAPGLEGDNCSEYSPFRMKADILDLYSPRTSLNVNQDLLVHLRGDQTVVRGNNDVDVQAYLPLPSDL